MTGTERDTCIDTRIIDKWTVGWMGKKPHRETDRQSVSHETTVVPDRDSKIYTYMTEQTKTLRQIERERGGGGKETERDRDRQTQTDRQRQRNRQR